MKKAVIVGGGISGLSTAYALLGHDDLEVLVLESEQRPGGKIWTDRTDGFLCEKGTNGFLDNKPKTLELCKSLGLEPVRSNENAKRRFIYSNKKLHEMSGSPAAFLRSGLLSWRGKLRILYELFAPQGPEEETVADFVIRRLGQEGLDKLIDPMCSGVYAGDPYKMSIKSCFPRIKELEREYGSLIKALVRIQRERKRTGGPEAGPAMGGNLTSFHDGADSITNALAQRLGDRLKLGVSVRGIARLSRRLAGESGSARDGKNRNIYQLHTSEGIVEADVLILAVPAYAASEILKDLDAQLSRTLADITYPPVSIVCLGYKKEKVQNSLEGFGFLVPRKEGLRVLGTLWDSSIFPNRAPDGCVLLRSMVGGAQSPDSAMLDDDKIVSVVFDELKPVVDLGADPEMVRVYRWQKAIPQYLIGHSERLKLMEERLKYHKGLYITGNAYRGVSMNDCVENSYKLADKIMD